MTSGSGNTDRCLVSVDGLSPTDLPHLMEQLPKSRKLLEEMSLSRLSGLFDAAQPVWAEILTGQPWHVNGCAGYSRPRGSLNDLTVFSEKDLKADVELLRGDDHKPDVVINLPLVHPSPGKRIWLSDGSLTINRVVSPSQLADEEPFKSYVPRPFPSLAFATGALTSAEKAIAVEQQRLTCARSLFDKRGWGAFVYRITLFDHLSHIIGLNFLKCEDLRIFATLKQFLERLDDALHDFISAKGVQFSMLSAYSHTVCTGAFNLSKVLEEGEFLQVDMLDQDAMSKRVRMKVVTAMEKRAPAKHRLDSTEARVNTSSSIACAPFAGAVYVNAQTRFKNGAVCDDDYAVARSTLGKYLRSWLQSRFENNASGVIEENPMSLREISESPAPEFILRLPGREQNDGQTSPSGIPRTTHSPTGFILLPKGPRAPESISPCEVIKYV